jgi:putative phosphoserine phosphatase / 1-acylglycerol-3-phosphate O-acyltransferase
METTSLKDRNTVKSYIAFFDLDRTITKAISGKELVGSAYKKGLMTHSSFARAVYLSLAYKLHLKDPQKIIDNMVNWAKGISEETMIDLCTEVFLMKILPSVYAEARSEIKIHKEKNAILVILSSSLAPVCQLAAENLGMDDIICSGLEVNNGYLTGHPLGHLCFGKEKMYRLQAYCEKNNIAASDSWYYGDSISDLNALCAVGNPVCINPDNKLKIEALKRGWKILLWI